MARRARSTTIRGLGELSIREYRSGLATLKRAGLISENVDVKRHVPTRHMREQLARFSGVVKGHAKAVNVGRQKAKDFAQTHPTKSGRVVVEAKRQDRVRYSKARNEISIKVSPTRRRGSSRNVIISPRAAEVMPSLKRGKIYGIGLRRGMDIDYIEIGDGEDLRFFLSGYSEKGKDLSAFVVTMETDGGNGDD